MKVCVFIEKQSKRVKKGLLGVPPGRASNMDTSKKGVFGLISSSAFKKALFSIFAIFDKTVNFRMFEF